MKWFRWMIPLWIRIVMQWHVWLTMMVIKDSCLSSSLSYNDVVWVAKKLMNDSGVSRCVCLVWLEKTLMNDSISSSRVSRCVSLVSLTKMLMNDSSVSRCVPLVWSTKTLFKDSSSSSGVCRVNYTDVDQWFDFVNRDSKKNQVVVSWICVYMYIYIYIRINICIHVYINIRTYIYIYIHQEFKLCYVNCDPPIHRYTDTPKMQLVWESDKKIKL